MGAHRRGEGEGEGEEGQGGGLGGAAKGAPMEGGLQGEAPWGEGWRALFTCMREGFSVP
jgi:hypothetical protein